MSELTLFVLSFLAATILPFPSEAPLAVVVRAEGRLLAPVLIATAGNLLGACTTYWLGRLARGAIEPAPTLKRVTTALALFGRFGPPALALSWVPVVGDVLVALAGAARVRFPVFSAWVVAGKLGRYAVVGWAALPS